MNEIAEQIIRERIERAEREATEALGFVACPGDHADCEPDPDGFHAFACVECGAQV